MNYYTVYRNRDESIAATGTARQCAEALDTSVDCFYCLVCRTRNGRNRKWSVVVDCTDEDKVREA